MQDKDANCKRSGALLLFCGVLATIAMAHHPIGSGQGPLTPLVHGTLQITLLLELGAFAVITRWLGGGLVASIGYACLLAGAGAGLIAGTINGFVVPSLGGYGSELLNEDLSAFAWHFNQALSRLGVFGTGMGYAAWSCLLWRDGHRRLAGFGYFAGSVPVLLLIADTISMEYHGALAAYVAQSMWLVALGWFLYRMGKAA